MAIAEGQIKSETVTTILETTATNSAGDWYKVVPKDRVYEVVITGTKSVDIEGSLDGVTALPTKIKSAITASAAFSTAEPIPYIRANPTSGSGTAQVRVAT